MLVWGSLSLTPTNLMVYHPHWGAPYLILHGEQRQLCMLMSLSLSAIVVLAVSLSQRQNGKIMWREQGRAKRLAWNGSKDRVRKCSYNTVKSALRVSMRGAVASETKNTHSSLEKWPYPCIQCGSKLHSHPQSLSITVHFAILLTFHTSWPTVPKAHATPT